MPEQVSFLRKNASSLVNQCTSRCHPRIGSRLRATNGLWDAKNEVLDESSVITDHSDIEQHKHIYRRQFIKDKIFQCDLVRAAGEALRRAALSQIDHHRWVIN